METSAVQDINVRDVFELLVQEIYNVKSIEQPKKEEKGVRILIHNDENLEGGGKKDNTCC
jgi:hypothetical protein